MILHLDIDCFYCSAERIRSPGLRGKAIAVGGPSNVKLFDAKPAHLRVMDANHGTFVPSVWYPPESPAQTTAPQPSHKGVVVTSSYEARKHGVKTGMSVHEALRFCPPLCIIPPDHRYYHGLSQQLLTLLQTFTPTVEQFSIDEFFCDISGINEAKDPVAYAKTIQTRIYEELQLPVSIGLSPAKWIAKLATEAAKPAGVWCVPREEIVAFIETKPVGSFPGIGKAFRARLQKHGIATLGEAVRAKHLFWQWKEPGKQLWRRIAGEDEEALVLYRPRKSIGMSRTFDVIFSREELRRRIVVLARHIAFMVLKHNVRPMTYYLHLRYKEGGKSAHQATRNRLFSEAVLRQEMLSLLATVDIAPRLGVTFLSLGVSNFTDQGIKSASLLDFEEDQRQHTISASLHRIRMRYGLDAIRCAKELGANQEGNFESE
jgi:DNA polymerase-4